MLFLGRAAWLVAIILSYLSALYSYPFAQSMMEVVAERMPAGMLASSKRPALPAAQLLDQTKTGTTSGGSQQLNHNHKKKPTTGWFGGWFKKK